MEEKNIPDQEELLPAEEEIQESVPKNRKKTRNRILYFGLMAIFVGVFICCAVYIVNYMVGSQQASGAYDDLSNLREQYLNSATRPENTLPPGVVPTLPGGDKDPGYRLQ